MVAVTEDFDHLLNKDILLSLLDFCGVCVLSLESSSSVVGSGESQGATAEFLTLTPKPSLSRAELGLCSTSDSGRGAADLARWGRVPVVCGFEPFFKIGRSGRHSA